MKWRGEFMDLADIEEDSPEPPKRSCTGCGKMLSRLNTSARCFSCGEDKGTRQPVVFQLRPKPQVEPRPMPSAAEIARLANAAEQSAQTRTADTRCARVIAAVSAVTGISVNDLTGSRRFAPIAHARQLAMYIIRMDLGWSYPWTAHVLNRSDHTTAIHAVRTTEKRLEASEHLRANLARIRAYLKESE